MSEPSRLSVRDAAISYRQPKGGTLRALDGVSFDVHRGEILGIVGESGCGKSSLAKRIVGLAPGEGKVLLDGTRIDDLSPREWKPLRRRIQYVFQDPLGSLDPRMPVLAQVCEPLEIHGIGIRKNRRKEATEMLETVGVAPHLHASAPIELSGGQRQRVVLARSLILKPDVLLCDEPVSALDVSIQAQILGLLLKLREAFGLTIVFISHDLAVVRHISHRVAVLYLGRIVEIGDVDTVFTRPAHPYTRMLLDSVPGSARRRPQQRERLAGEATQPVEARSGCAFAPRCPWATSHCEGESPVLKRLLNGSAAACHHPDVSEQAA